MQSHYLSKTFQETGYKTNMDVLRRCPGVGRRIISFHEAGWNNNPDGRTHIADVWWLVRHKERGGTYGKIGGGMKNIECFIEWCMEDGAYCFNGINIDDLEWSPVNDAYIRKDMAHIFGKIPIEVKARYVFQRDDDYKITKVFALPGAFFNSAIPLWSKEDEDRGFSYVYDVEEDMSHCGTLFESKSDAVEALRQIKAKKRIHEYKPDGRMNTRCLYKPGAHKNDSKT